METVIGKVENLEGKFFAIDKDENIVALSPGDEISEGMTVFGDENNSPSDTIEIAMVNGTQVVSLSGANEQLFDESLIIEDGDAMTAALSEESVSGSEGILAALEKENANQEEAIDETAAGEEDGQTTDGREGEFAQRDGSATDISAGLRNAPFASNGLLQPQAEIIPITEELDFQPIAGDSFATVDGDGLRDGNPLSTDGDDDANASENPITPSEAIFSGTLNFSATGDFPLTVDFAAMNGQTGTVGTETVAYNWNAITGTLTADGPRGVLFTVTLDSDTGDYTVTQLDNVLHPSLDGEVGDNTENNVETALTFTVTDSNGSTANGTLTVNFDDDMPTVSVEVNEGDGILGDVMTDETYQLGVPVSGGHPVIIVDDNLGADGGNTVISLDITDSVTDFKVTDGGYDITLVPHATDSSIIYGQYNDGTDDLNAFTVSIDQSGVLTVTQHVAMVHPDNPDNYDEPIDLTGKLDAVATATDNDGDTVEDGVAVGHLISFKDDGPSATAIGEGLAQVTVDETYVDTTDDGVDNPTSGLGVPATVDASTLFAASSYGADGAGSVAYSLNIASQPTNWETTQGDYAILLVYAQVDDGTGTSTMVDDTTTVLGQYNDGTSDLSAFTITIDSSGEVKVTQHVAMDHPDDTDHNDDLILNNLDVVQTVTDGDDDTATASNDLSVTFLDDGPIAEAKAAGEVTVDETYLDTTDDGVDNPTSGLGVPATVDASTLFTASSYGADGTGSVAYSLDATLGDTGFTTTDGGYHISLSYPVTTYGPGYDTGIVYGQYSQPDPSGLSVSIEHAFTITIDKNTGLVTVKQHVAMDHLVDGANDATLDPNPHNDELILNSIDVVQTVKDGDDDVATASNNLSVIFLDDGPVVEAKDGAQAGTELDETDITVSATIAAADVKALFEVDYGTDKEGATPAEYSLSGVNVGTSVATGLYLAGGTDEIMLVNNGGVYEGRVNGTGALVFEVEIANDTGEVTVTQHQAMDHVDDPDDVTADTSTTDYGLDHEDTPLDLDGLIKVDLTVTDGDGDTATSTSDSALNIKFYDDGPTAAGADDLSERANDITLDETTDTTAGTGLNVASILGATVLFDTSVSVYGADGAGTMTYSLGLVNPAGTGTGFYLAGAAPTTANEIMLVEDGTGGYAGYVNSEYTAYETAHGAWEIAHDTWAAIPLNVFPEPVEPSLPATVFTVTIDSLGEVTVTQQQAMEHADDHDVNQNTSPADAVLDHEDTPLLLDNIQVVQTVEDADGDTDTVAAPLNISFADDGPTIDVELDEAELLLQESFENFRESDGWHVEHGDGDINGVDNSSDTTIDGDHGVVWDVGTEGVEIQTNIVRTSDDGNSHAELDPHDFDGHDGNTVMTTSVDLNGSNFYTLEFAYQPRATGGTSDMEVEFAGKKLTINSTTNNLVETMDPNDGSIEVSTTDAPNGWTTFTVVYSGVTGDTADLTFRGAGEANKIGALLDDIKLYSGLIEPMLTVDETDLSTDATDVSFAGLFTSISEAGADGQDGDVTTKYSLGVKSAGADSGLVDTATGDAVLLNVITADVVEGRTAAGELVFTVSVDSAGKVTLDQDRAVEHPIDGDNSNNEHDDSVTLDADDLVTLTRTDTITDNDGDTATDSASINIGQNLNFRDDGPSITENPDSTELVTFDNAQFENVIINGSFENLTGSRVNSDGSTEFTDDNDISSGGWTAYQGMEGWQLMSETARWMEPHDKAHMNIGTTDDQNYMDLGESLNDTRLNKSDDYEGNTHIGQTISCLKAEENYTLTFDMKEKGEGDSSKLEVLFNGNSYDIDTDTSITKTPLVDGWVQVSIVVTALEGNNLLEFKEFGSSDNHGTALDNISMVITDAQTFTGSLTDTGGIIADFGADGKADGTGVKPDGDAKAFELVEPADTTEVDYTLSADKLTLMVEKANGDDLFKVELDGDTGVYTVTQYDSIPDSITSVPFVITDGDGDTARGAIELQDAQTCDLPDNLYIDISKADTKYEGELLVHKVEIRDAVDGNLVKIPAGEFIIVDLKYGSTVVTTDDDAELNDYDGQTQVKVYGGTTGSFVYVEAIDDNFAELDETYTIAIDGYTLSPNLDSKYESSEVTIDTNSVIGTILDNDDAPEAEDDSGVATETGHEFILSEDSEDMDAHGHQDELQATGFVLANDTGSNLSVTSVEFDGSPYVVPTNGSEITITGLYGSLTIDNTGEYKYVVNESTTDSWNMGDSQDEIFTYTATDGVNTPVEADLTITVEGRDDAPVISSITANSQPLHIIDGLLDVDGNGIVDSLNPDDLTVVDQGKFFNAENGDLNINMGTGGSSMSVEYNGGQAGYHNVLGYYTADENGNPIAAHIIHIEDASFVGSLSESLGTLNNLEGNVGFFIIPDGGRDSAIELDSVITFKNGNMLVDNAIKEAFYTDNDLNQDGYDHVVAGKTVNGNGLVIAFEDLQLGDKDYDDVVITIYPCTNIGGEDYFVDLGKIAENDQQYTWNGDANNNADWSNVDSMGSAVTISALNFDGTTGSILNDGDYQLGVEGTRSTGDQVPNQLHYDEVTDQSQGIVLEFEGDLNKAEFNFTRLIDSENEQGHWAAYKDGNLVSEGDLNGDGLGNNPTFSIDTGNNVFDKIVFTAVQYDTGDDGTSDSSDYYLQSFQGSGPTWSNGENTILTDINLSDVDDANLESAIMTLTNFKAGDSISADNLPSAITATINDGVVELTGTATKADYELALESLTFETTSDDRTTRVFEFTVFDGDKHSNTMEARVDIGGCELNTYVSVPVLSMEVESAPSNVFTPHAYEGDGYNAWENNGNFQSAQAQVSFDDTLGYGVSNKNTNHGSQSTAIENNESLFFELELATNNIDVILTGDASGQSSFGQWIAYDASRNQVDSGGFTVSAGTSIPLSITTTADFSYIVFDAHNHLDSASHSETGFYVKVDNMGGACSPDSFVYNIYLDADLAGSNDIPGDLTDITLSNLPVGTDLSYSNAAGSGTVTVDSSGEAIIPIDSDGLANVTFTSSSAVDTDAIDSSVSKENIGITTTDYQSDETTLTLDGDIVLDFSNTNIESILSVENISLDSGTSQNLTLSLDDILDMTEDDGTGNHTLDISSLGISHEDSVSVVDTSNTWSDATSRDNGDGTHSFDYTNTNGTDSITLTVDDQIDTIV